MKMEDIPQAKILNDQLALMEKWGSMPLKENISISWLSALEEDKEGKRRELETICFALLRDYYKAKGEEIRGKLRALGVNA